MFSMEILKEFTMVFLPLFVAIDAIGMLPIYSTLTSDLDIDQKKVLLRQSVFSGCFVGVLFLFFGTTIFSFLGITTNDFMIGGGILLLLIAVGDILTSQKEKRRSEKVEIGVVPLGVPLMIGPAALTTIILLSGKHGLFYTLVSLLANMALVWFIFRLEGHILNVLGKSGTKTVGKLISILLMAIAVMMIRTGIQNTFF